jgi:protein-disulfide isomerase
MYLNLLVCSGLPSRTGSAPFTLRPQPVMRLAIAVRPVTAFLLAAVACRAPGTSEQRPAAGAANVAGAGGGGTAAAAAPADGTRPGADSIALRAAADSGRIQGAPGAKTWLIMVSDFQCPYCKQWHDQSYEALRKEYVTGGRARAAFMNFPLDQHAQAMPAAEAAMCASAQALFWPYHTALYTTQARWAAMSDARPVFDSLATAVGADLGRFRACTGSHVMRALVEADRERMQRAGVRSTPSFFVGDRQLAGAQPTSAFREALDAATR